MIASPRCKLGSEVRPTTVSFELDSFLFFRTRYRIFFGIVQKNGQILDYTFWTTSADYNEDDEGEEDQDDATISSRRAGRGGIVKPKPIRIHS